MLEPPVVEVGVPVRQHLPCRALRLQELQRPRHRLPGRPRRQDDEEEELYACTSWIWFARLPSMASKEERRQRPPTGQPRPRKEAVACVVLILVEQEGGGRGLGSVVNRGAPWPPADPLDLGPRVGGDGEVKQRLSGCGRRRREARSPVEKVRGGATVVGERLELPGGGAIWKARRNGWWRAGAGGGID